MFLSMILSWSAGWKDWTQASVSVARSARSCSCWELLRYIAFLNWVLLNRQLWAVCDYNRTAWIAKTFRYLRGSWILRRKRKNSTNLLKNPTHWRRLQGLLFTSILTSNIRKQWLDLTFHRSAAQWSSSFCHRAPPHNQHEKQTFPKSNEERHSFSLTLQRSSGAV